MTKNYTFDVGVVAAFCACIAILLAPLTVSHAADLTVYEKGWEECPSINDAHIRHKDLYRSWSDADYTIANEKAAKTDWYVRNDQLLEGMAACGRHVDQAKTDRARYEAALILDRQAYDAAVYAKR